MQIHAERAQASIDMLVAYGVALLLVSISIYVLLQLGVFNSRLAPSYCNPAPGFTCTAVAINKNGVATLVFAQATGATLNITGVACSNNQNDTITGPKYGNFNVLPYNPNTIAYYPNSQLSNGIIVYSSSSTRIQANCFVAPNNLAKGALGNSFSGFIWINYSINSLPGSYHNVQQLVSFSTKYT
jgi:uncharacterized protein (UPF0333 family)